MIHHKTLIHIGQVLGVNAGAVAISLTNINIVLTTLSIVAALTYTCIKIYKELKKK